MKKLFTSIAILLAALFIYSPVAEAKVVSKEGGTIRVEKNEVIDDDLFVAAQVVEIDGIVNGDVFLGAQTVSVTGNVNGNLHVGANMLTLSGTIKGNVYAGAQNILVTGANIGGSFLAGAATVDIDKDTIIGGSVLAGASVVSLDSQIKRSVYAGVGNLAVGDNSVIGKDLYYVSDNDKIKINISEKAKIGAIHRSEINTPQVETAKMKSPAAMGTFKKIGAVISFAGALIVGFLYYKLFGEHLSLTGKIVTRSFWKSAGIGFLTMISFIPGFFILLITVIGAPVAMLALLILFIFIYLAKIVVGLALGNWISRKFNWKTSIYGTFVLGLLSIFILRSIPVIGFFSGLLVLWVGLGALLQTVSTKVK